VEQAAAHNSLTKKLTNTELLKYVHETSPLRNPLHWPPNVIPTKHPKSNLMKTSLDPTNPYLFQPQFVAPRMDMYFRRPSLVRSAGRKKGQYDPDDPALLDKRYTVPYFPEIVDVAMAPLPWTFLGSREAYYEKSGGRALGLRLTNYALQGHINPLSDNPAPPTMPLLAEELKKLETQRYGEAPIAFLRPRGANQNRPALGEAHTAQALTTASQGPLKSGDSEAAQNRPHADLQYPPL
jgi:hypothetical protein